MWRGLTKTAYPLQVGREREDGRQRDLRSNQLRLRRSQLCGGEIQMKPKFTLPKRSVMLSSQTLNFVKLAVCIVLLVGLGV